MTSKRVLPPVYLLISLVAMLGLHYLFPVRQILSSPWRWLGLIPLVVGVVLNLVADFLFKRAGTTVKPFEASAALVKVGVYGISRHPMYLGLVLLTSGVAMLLGSLTPFLIVLVFGLVVDRRFIAAEEVMLEAQFEDEWREYCGRVRRWI